MKIRRSLVAMMVGMSLLVVGCGDTTSNNEVNTDGNTTQEKEVDHEQAKLDVIQPNAYGNVNGLTLEPGTSFSIIGRGGTAAYWDAVEAGAEKAVNDLNELLGYKGEDKIKVVYSAPETENGVDEQVNLLDEELARYPAAIGIAMVDAEACTVQFDLATENNIPIVAFDAGTEYQNIVSLVKTDDVDAATMAANKLCDLIGDEGEIAVIVHDRTSMTAKERESAFTSTIANEHPNVKIVEVYHLDELEEKKAAMEAESGTSVELTQEDIVKGILEAYPNVKGIYATSESAADVVVGTLENVENPEMKVVSFDGGESQLARLEEGKISGLIVQNPFGIGYATIVASARAVLGQGNEAVVDTGYTWVTADNFNEPAIQNMMY